MTRHRSSNRSNRSKKRGGKGGKGPKGEERGSKDETEDGEPAYGAAMTALNWIVGFLLVYRAQQSYARCAVLYAAIF